jgi:hypothetical protein
VIDVALPPARTRDPATPSRFIERRLRLAHAALLHNRERRRGGRWLERQERRPQAHRGSPPWMDRTATSHPLVVVLIAWEAAVQGADGRCRHWLLPAPSKVALPFRAHGICCITPASRAEAGAGFAIAS